MTRSRSQRGEAVSALLVLAAFVIEGIVFVGIAAFGAMRLAVEDRMTLNQCLRTVDASKGSLIRRFGFLGNVPPDDPDVLAIKRCKVQLDQIVAKPQLDGGATVRNVQTAVDGPLRDFARCRVLSVSPGSPTAGITRVLTVNAVIPLAGGNVSGTITLRTEGGSQFSGPILLGPGGATGSVAVPDNVSRSLGGTVSEVSFTADSHLGQAVNGQCPGLITPTPGGECVLSCPSAVKNVVWRDPPIPQIALFNAIPSTVVRGRLEPFFLVWNVKNAASVAIDQAIGEVDKSGSWLELPPDNDTTYTLTAMGVRIQDTRTATVKVTVQEPPSVTLSSPGSNTTVTTDSVQVSGTLAPAVPGTSAEISVNGVPKLTVPIDGAGNFEGSVELDKRTTLFDLVLTNPNTAVDACGARAAPVTLQNPKTLADVTNVISVNVAGVTPPVTASATVFHAVQVTGFRVTWNTCPPLNKDESPVLLLTAGNSVQVGTVDCGVTDPGGFQATCSVTADVDTSVGGLGDIATWTFDVPSCP